MIATDKDIAALDATGSAAALKPVLAPADLTRQEARTPRSPSTAPTERCWRTNRSGAVGDCVSASRSVAWVLQRRTAAAAVPPGWARRRCKDFDGRQPQDPCSSMRYRPRPRGGTGPAAAGQQRGRRLDDAADLAAQVDASGAEIVIVDMNSPGPRHAREPPRGDAEMRGPILMFSDRSDESMIAERSVPASAPMSWTGSTPRACKSVSTSPSRAFNKFQILK